MSIKNLEIKPSEAKAVEIASLPTRPTSSATYGGRGLTAQEMKKAYDAYPALIKERFNALIADLLSGIAINDIPFSIPAHEPFGENIEQTVKGFLDAVGAILDFGTDNARTIFGFVKQFVNDVAKATSLTYDKSTQLLSLTIDGQKKSVKIDLDEFKNEIANLKESKLDKTGGTISGNLEVTGNLTVLGKTIQTVLEKLNVKDAVIVTNADGSTLTVLSGFATRTGSNTTYGIMYDPTSDSVKLGIVTVDENGVWHFADGEGSPVATRADSSNMADGKVVTWNTAKRRMETTTIPAVVDSAPTNGSSNLVTSGAVWQSEEDLTSLIFSVGNGWGIHYEKDYDMLVLRNGFTSVESTVVLGIKDINDRVDLLSTLIFNTIITNTTVEDTYTTRVTAGGLPVVSNTPTTVHKIAGETKATENLFLLTPRVAVTSSITANNNTWTFNGLTPSNTYTNFIDDIDITDAFEDGEKFTISQSQYYDSYKTAGAVYLNVQVRNGGTIVQQYNCISSATTVTMDKSLGSYYLRLICGNNLTEMTQTISFMVNVGETALPYSDYYAGLKNASFKGVTSTGSNIVDIYGQVGEGITKYGVTIKQEQDGYLHFSGIPTGNYRQLFTISQDLFQDGETYTFAQSQYFGVPGTGHTLKNSLYWSIVQTNLDTGDTNYSYLSTTASSKSMTFDKKHYSYLIYIVTGSYSYTSGDEMDISLRFWINRGSTALPYEDYTTDTSFQLSVARQLRKWDYIDVDNQRVVTGTAEVTQDTEFTDEELATYPAGYILSADRKTIVYPLETPTTAALTVPKTYTAWRNGSETVDTGATDALPPTITQTYYEEVTA